jgi:alkylation response protein AidB-like acyl-CoA dehydrogenase
MHLQPSSRQRELIALARRLARERFAPRTDRHDRDASFPFDDYAVLRDLPRAHARPMTMPLLT